MNHLLERQTAIFEAKREVSRKPIYLDTETTGLEGTDQIIEICVLDHDGTVLIDSLVKPTGPIPPDAMRIHGITNGMVKDAPPWPDLWPQVKTAIADRRVAIYNSEFDVRLMRQSHRKHQMSWEMPNDLFCCVMKLYARFYGQWDSYRGSYRWQNLEAAGRQCKIALPNAHRAHADTLLARAVLQYMAGQAR
jgi:DNA polymerase III subunit epsilon